MKVYNSLEAMQRDAVPMPILAKREALIASMLDEDSRPGGYKRPADSPQYADDFDYHLGGKLYIVETVEDLKKISGLEESKLPKEEQDPDTGGWASLYESPSTADICEWLPGGEWLEFCIIWNNDGGPDYYIPKSVVDQAPNDNLNKTIALNSPA